MGACLLLIYLDTRNFCYIQLYAELGFDRSAPIYSTTDRDNRVLSRSENPPPSLALRHYNSGLLRDLISYICLSEKSFAFVF